jgi:hypothetical protein
MMRLTALWLTALTGADGVAHADSAVILGVGQIGNWVTTGFAANPNSSQVDLTVQGSPIAPTAVPCPPGTCIYGNFSLPPQGSGMVPFPFTSSQFGTAYASQVLPPGAGTSFPIIQASLADVSGSCRAAVGTPVILLSRLIAADISRLNFPRVPPAGQSPRPGVGTNLVLGNIQRADGAPEEELPLLLELFDLQGKLIGSTSLTLAYGETLAFGDVLSLRNAAEIFPGGQLRVSRVSGHALMWGILYTVDPESGVTASTGVNLSP